MCFVFASPQNASAHWDAQPSGDPYHITVILKRIDYNEDAGDWEDSFSGADLVVGWRAELSGHDLATNSGTIAREDISLNEGGQLRLDLTILDHDECTPLSDLRLFVWGVESDQDNTLDTNNMMREIVTNGDLSSGPVEAKGQVESVGDQWIGFGSKVSRGATAEGFHFESEVHIPLDDAERLDAEFLVERNSVRDTGQCDQVPQRTSMAIPDWIRQNAAWWSDGAITDRDFASGIGFLVKEKIISVNVPTSEDGTMLVNDDLQIPSWLRNNAKWWSDGIISDQDFTSGIEYMVKQKIVTFSEKKPVSKSSTLGESEGRFKALYLISKRNEEITSSLIQINQYEKRILGDAVDSAWERYGKTKNPSDLKAAQTFDGSLKNVEKRIQLLIKTESVAKQDTQNLLKKAAKDGIKKLDLEKATKDKIGAAVKPDTVEKLSQTLKDVENANKQNIKDLEKTSRLPAGTILDQLLFGQDRVQKNPDGKNTHVDAVRITDLFDSALDNQFFEKYFEISDHIPIQSVFAANWVGLQETQADAAVIRESISGQSPDWQEPKPDAMITTDVKTPPTETVPDEKEPTETQSAEDEKQVAVLVINGKYYPLSQFFKVSAHQPNCDALHYHSELSQVRSTDGAFFSDPNPSTCGFGKVGLIAVDVITITKEQIDAFKKDIGFEP
jgi:hypothetical protein